MNIFFLFIRFSTIHTQTFYYYESLIKNIFQLLFSKRCSKCLTIRCPLLLEQFSKCKTKFFFPPNFSFFTCLLFFHSLIEWRGGWRVRIRQPWFHHRANAQLARQPSHNSVILRRALLSGRLEVHRHIQIYRHSRARTSWFMYPSSGTYIRTNVFVFIW